MEILFFWLLVCLANQNEANGAREETRVHSEITSVPGDLPSDIEKLNIYRNRIEVIRQMDFNDKFPKLWFLNLCSNLLVNVEKGCFKGTILNHIFLSNNQLTAIPDFREVSYSLEYIALISNNITKISTEEINYLPKLRTLYLNSNPIVSLLDAHFSPPPPFIILGLEGISIECHCGVAWLKRIPDLRIDTNPCKHPPEWNSTSLDEITEEMLLKQPITTGHLYMCVSFVLTQLAMQPGYLEFRLLGYK
ncbi:hypothetical protein CAPTEDRAFT_189715 [Capitella teleta]|uniref:LRRCT domain-containing protein n=1 Tax=Capitella teleta TaxID=283909 RepID=R7TAN2_CAPTE|nr:hypothetical protein CAPTEDRAFT_189715 [Capitella teleta]|eukprot:ELT90764.1 hypothetical protein CAPTEDRAFT_189715 [Capitella teleta]